MLLRYFGLVYRQYDQFVLPHPLKFLQGCLFWLKQQVAIAQGTAERYQWVVPRDG